MAKPAPSANDRASKWQALQAFFGHFLASPIIRTARGTNEDDTPSSSYPYRFLKTQVVFLRPVADSVALLNTQLGFLRLQLAANASFAKASEQFGYVGLTLIITDPKKRPLGSAWQGGL